MVRLVLLLLAACEAADPAPPTCAEVAQAWCVWPHRCPEVGSPDDCVANLVPWCEANPTAPQVSRGCFEALRDPQACVGNVKGDWQPEECWP